MGVVVVGAGLAGLVAAKTLRTAGADVTVIDKGRSPGGRLATRRIGDARLDHGAQFFTVRSPTFGARVEAWMARGLARVWTYGFQDGDGHPRYVATEGMTALAKDLADGVDVEYSTMAFSVRPGTGRARWEVVIDDGSTRPADAVVVTCPLPQAFSLLVESGVDLDEGPFRTDYDRTIGLLAVLDRPSAVPDPGGVQRPDPTFAFIADNRRKGISPVPALTLHASPDWSEAHWHDDDAAIADELEEAARCWLDGATVVDRQVKRWRFATPRDIWPDPCWQGADGTIVLAGDAFAGPRMEGAHDSGLAAARTLLA